MAASTREEIIPIDPNGASPSERGQIAYRYNTPTEPTGVFSFAWYYRPKPSAGNRDQTEPTIAGKYHTYLLGMSKYYGLTDAAAFAGWKVVIYTDQATLAAIRQLPETAHAPARTLAADLLARPNVIVALCEWPEFSQTQTADSIDGVILRTLRHKALMDFPRIPVFVRDADTYFTDELDRHSFDTRLLVWESTMLERHRNSGLPFLVSGTPTYSRVWHKNRLHGTKSEGVLAGLVNRVAEIPEWTDGSLWRESLSFIRGRCHIVADTGALSNVREGTYIGKDEQVIIFIWIPTLLDRTFFFYFDFHEHGLTAGYYLGDWSYSGSKYEPPHPHRGTIDALMAEFPDYIQGGSLSAKMGESPRFKLTSAFDSRPIGTPNPGNVPPTEEEIQEERVAAFERGIKLRRFTEADRHVLEESRGLSTFDFTLLHPFVVTHAFDFPPYQRIMYHMFRETTEKYRVVCDRARGAGAGGWRKRLRKTRRRAASKRTTIKRRR